MTLLKIRIWGFYSVTTWKGHTSTLCSNIVRDNRFQGRVLETFVPYVHEVVVRYMAQSWVPTDEVQSPNRGAE